MLTPCDANGGLAMIDCGHNVTSGWRPSAYIRTRLRRAHIHHLFVTNSDQDHLNDLDGLWQHGVTVGAFARNRSITPDSLRLMKCTSGALTNDMSRYLDIHTSRVHPIQIPFDGHMGGATATMFNNTRPQ
jgi:hypothetical protein